VIQSMSASGPTIEPTADEVRLAADEVSRKLISMLEDMRGEQAPSPIGVDR
jgi:hypothetical protein